MPFELMSVKNGLIVFPEVVSLPNGFLFNASLSYAFYYRQNVKKLDFHFQMRNVV